MRAGDGPSGAGRYGPLVLNPSLTEAAADIAAVLVERGETLATAESSAGGLVSAAMLSVPGASAYARGGIVIYTLDGVETMLGGAVGLDPGRRGATEQLARFLAAASAARLGADWGVGETGATGPSPNPYGDPAGHAWVAVAGPGDLLRTEHVLTGSDDRGANMEAFALRALTLLGAALREA